MVLNDCKGLDIGCVNLSLLLCADDTVIYSETELRLQEGIDVFFEVL